MVGYPIIYFKLCKTSLFNFSCLYCDGVDDDDDDDDDDDNDDDDGDDGNHD